MVPTMMRSASRRAGFTRRDLSVGLFALVLCSALLVPACSSSVSTQQARARSNNNLKQIGLAVQMVAATYDGLLPPSAGMFPGSTKGGSPNGSFFFHLLPFVEQANLYNEHRENPAGVPKDVRIAVYVAEDDPSAAGGPKGVTSYASNAAVFTLTDGGWARFPAVFIEKGTSNTVIVMERFAVVGKTGTPHLWAGVGKTENYLYPPKAPFQPTDPATITNPQFDVSPGDASDTAPHAFRDGTIQVLLADGSSKLLTVGVTNTFTYGEGRKAPIWAWACSVQGPITNTPSPQGW
jgi:hypothetical protein